MKPTSRDFALGGMNRTIDFLHHKEITIMGLVTMMDGYLCSDCGKVTHQLLFPKLAMEKVAKDCGVPFLISIPQTPAVALLRFSEQNGRRHGGKWPPCRRKVATVTEEIGRVVKSPG